MIVPALLVAILVVAIFQRSADRRFPALVFAVISLVHCAFMTDLVGFWYFFTACLCDVAIIAVIATYARVNFISDALLTISLFSFVANIFGFILWINDLPVVSYNNTITALYLITIYFLFARDCAHDFNRNRQYGGWLRVLSD